MTSSRTTSFFFVFCIERRSSICSIFDERSEDKHAGSGDAVRVLDHPV